MLTGNAVTSCKVFDKNTTRRCGDYCQKYAVLDLATCG